MMQEHLFERMARERGITVEEMRAIILRELKKAGMILIYRSGSNGEKFLVLMKFLHRRNG